MNIILEPSLTQDIREKYLLLELDSFVIQGLSAPIKSFCVLDRCSEQETTNIKQWVDLHGNLMPEFRKRNWNYVEQSIEHLKGQWGGMLDSFYAEIEQRVSELRDTELDDDWDGSIKKPESTPGAE